MYEFADTKRLEIYNKQVVFTSDVSGYGNVYLVDVPEFGTLPVIDE